MQDSVRTAVSPVNRIRAENCVYSIHGSNENVATRTSWNVSNTTHVTNAIKNLRAFESLRLFLGLVSLLHPEDKGYLPKVHPSELV